jgi:hypothetical protein
MLVSQWIRRQHAVVSAALVCHKQASTGEIVSSTNLGMYGNTESLLKFSSRSWAPIDLVDRLQGKIQKNKNQRSDQWQTKTHPVASVPVCLPKIGSTAATCIIHSPG